MALTFQTIGFINFNKEYNKVLKSGSITVSFTTTIYIFFDFGFKPNRFEKSPFGMINFPIVNLDKI